MQSRDNATRTSVVENHGGEGPFRNRARLEHTQRRLSSNYKAITFHSEVCVGLNLHRITDPSNLPN